MTISEGGAAPYGLALRLARRELRGGLRGFRAFLASLVLGIGAIAAVGSLTESLLDGLRGDGRVLLGGDLDLRLAHREITAEQRAWLEARGRLSQVTHLRAMAHKDGAHKDGAHKDGGAQGWDPKRWAAHADRAARSRWGLSALWHGRDNSGAAAG